MGQEGLEPSTALSTGFTVRGDTNYTVLTHMGELVGLEPTSRSFPGRTQPLSYSSICGVDGEIRTPDQLLRRQLLYPSELHPHIGGTGWD